MNDVLTRGLKGRPTHKVLHAMRRAHWQLKFPSTSLQTSDYVEGTQVLRPMRTCTTM